MEFFHPGQILQERYRVDRLLGEGGMSWVYRAHHLLLQQAVALKVIKPLGGAPTEQRDHAEQLCVEAGLIARLDHPNLVRAFDLFKHDGLPVLVLEMVDGRDLEQVAELAPKQISERRVLHWAAAILDALEYLHAQEPPVIVRDLKPKNVMLDRNGRIRLIDFGLAKETSTGTRAFVRGMGSEGYAPLEQYAQKSTDARADLYAFGATLYYLLTKLAPPPASLRVSEDAPLQDIRKINSTVSRQTWTVIQRLLALRPDDRPSNAVEVRGLLGLDEVEKEAPPELGRRCPQCRLLLQAERHQGVDVDLCRECGGIWLDRGELGRLVELGREAVPKGQERKTGRPSPPDHTDDLSGKLRHNDDTDDLSRKLRYRDDTDDRKNRKDWRSPTYIVWKILKELFD